MVPERLHSGVACSWLLGLLTAHRRGAAEGAAEVNLEATKTSQEAGVRRAPNCGPPAKCPMEAGRKSLAPPRGYCPSSNAPFGKSSGSSPGGPEVEMTVLWRVRRL